MDGDRKTWIGVDIGGTKTAVVLSSEPPAMLARIEFPTLPDLGPDRAIELIKQSIHKLIDSSGVEHSSLAAIGVSCGGPLDQAAGVIQAPPNLATWIDVPITAILRRGVRTGMQNGKRRQCRGGCRASIWSGAGNAAHDFPDHGDGIRRRRDCGWTPAERSARPGRRDRPRAADCHRAGGLQQGGIGGRMGEWRRNGASGSSRG